MSSPAPIGDEFLPVDEDAPLPVGDERIIITGDDNNGSDGTGGE